MQFIAWHKLARFAKKVARLSFRGWCLPEESAFRRSVFQSTSRTRTDHKPNFVLRLYRRGLFQYTRDIGSHWPALQELSQFLMLFRRPHGKHFHPPVPKISHETADSKLLCEALRVEAKAHTLDHSRYKIPFG